MGFRLARTGDLPELKAMYRKLINRMDAQGVRIWDEVYPCEFFCGDIEAGRLYVLVEEGMIAAAFALCRENEGEKGVCWADAGARAVYLDRLGVNADLARRGLGRMALDEAAKLARGMGAEYLRLFAVDINLPAIALYRRAGFAQAEGTFQLRIDEALTLTEYGFEKKLR